jgi:hypothetical protein
MQPQSATDRWHELLNARYVCQACTTRFFHVYRFCPACHQMGTIHPFLSSLMTVAHSDEELRLMISHGQRVVPDDVKSVAS